VSQFVRFIEKPSYSYVIFQAPCLPHFVPAKAVQIVPDDLVQVNRATKSRGF